jgi:hypothetical protein
MKTTSLLTLSLILLVAAPLSAVTSEEAHEMMSRYCFDCHGAKKQKSELNLEQTFASTLSQDHRLLSTMLEVVTEGDMPPEEAKAKPTAVERAALVNWITTARTTLAKASQDDPGQVVMGRLTKAQYDYVIRDLTGHDLRAAKYFPDDVTATSGFNNAGAELSVSATHIDSYLQAAKTVLSHAMITPERGIRWFDQPVQVVEKPEELRKAVLNEWLNWHLAEEGRALRWKFGDSLGLSPEETARERAVRVAAIEATGETISPSESARLAIDPIRPVRARTGEKISPSESAKLEYLLGLLIGPSAMERVTRETLRFADYWEAAWLVHHGADVNQTAAEGTSPLVVPVLRDWVKILSNRQPTALVGHLCEWWQHLPAPSAATRVATRTEAKAWEQRLLALMVAAPANKTWFSTQGLGASRYAAKNGDPLGDGPGEVSFHAPESPQMLALIAKRPGYPDSQREVMFAHNALVENAQFAQKIDLKAFGGREMVLVATDAWDGPAGDVVHWREPTFHFADGHKHTLDEITLQAPSTRKVSVPDGATFFTATVQLSDRDKAHASAQAIVLNREPSGDWARLWPRRHVLAWPEGRKRWETQVSDFLALVARSAVINGRVGQKIYATDFLPAGAMPKLADSRAGDELSAGPYYLDQSELVEMASPAALAVRATLQRDLIAVAQLPLRQLGGRGKGDVPEGKIPADWSVEKRAAAERFIAENTAKARRQLAGFLRQAWRRDITPAEVDRITSLFVQDYSEGASYDAAMKRALLPALVSSKFLYRMPVVAATETSGTPTPAPATLAGRGVVKLSPTELANRLSFFLWSSLPDQALLDAASAGEVEVKAHLARMMKDDRIGRLAEECFGRWLGFNGFADWTAPDTQRFPEFTPTLSRAMHDETRAFVTALLRENRPLTELIRSDRTFLNEELAKHYGIAHVTGAELREVKLNSSQRGGLVGMGALLTKTSAPLRTSPVRRGAWLVETVLGRRIPPPPPNVTNLISADEKDGKGATISQQLAKHRADANCAACHAKIDPPGIVLEHFDPIGRWRDTYREGVPIVSSSEMDGGTMNGFEGLQDYLTKHIEEVARTFCERLLEFGLTRHEEAGDAALLERMFTAMKADGWRVQPAFEQLVTSQQFTHRRANPLIASSERK